MGTVKKVKDIIMDALTYTVIAVLIAGGIMMALGIRPFITMSGSMEPKIKTGSVCFVNTRASFYDVAEGDVIAFQTASGGLVTHRVIGAEDDGMVLVTKGDNNDVEDGPTTTVENFRGETLFSIPYIGYALAALQKPQYKIMAGVVVAALVLLVVVDLFCKGEDDD